MDRPSSIPSRLDTNKYDAMGDADFAEALEDFAAIFDIFKPKVPLSTSLNNALRRSNTCVFYCAIATAASKRPAIVEAAQQRELECDIRSWQQRNYRDRDDRTYPYLELVVHVKSSKNRDNVPWLPERLRDLRIEPSINEDLEFIADDPLLVLELINKEPDDTSIPGDLQLGEVGGLVYLLAQE